MQRGGVRDACESRNKVRVENAARTHGALESIDGLSIDMDVQEDNTFQ